MRLLVSANYLEPVLRITRMMGDLYRRARPGVGLGTSARCRFRWCDFDCFVRVAKEDLGFDYCSFDHCWCRDVVIVAVTQNSQTRDPAFTSLSGLEGSFIAET